MKKLIFAVVTLLSVHNRSEAAFLLHNDYAYLQEITFELYNDDVPAYKVPEAMKSIEETLMFDVLHATWKDKHWVAYTLNKDLLGTYRVGQPALLDNGDTKKIFFVAAFPGAVGGTDLYTAEYINGKWSKPKNLGKGINTAGNESNPGLLDENTLTYSSAGIIKKLDLKTLKVTDMVEAPLEEKKVFNPIVVQEKLITAPVVEPSKPTVSIAPPVVEVQKPPKVETPTIVAETPKKVENTVQQSVVTQKLVENKPSAVAIPEVQEHNLVSLGVQSRETMLAKYQTAIQLGAFMTPKWDKINPLSKYGKLVTYKNENGVNVIWLVGFANHAAAETALQQVKSIVGFENAYITGK
ncbi:MAG: hypothetical protein RL494_1482 [Bacteroidota bacterium]|jgi:hypothetical protein